MGQFKISERMVLMLREAYAKGESTVKLSKRTGITYSNVNNIVKGYTYKYYGGPTSERKFVRLIDKQVIEIKKLINKGETDSAIAKKFLVTSDTIINIRTCKSWVQIGAGTVIPKLPSKRKIRPIVLSKNLKTLRGYYHLNKLAFRKFTGISESTYRTLVLNSGLGYIKPILKIAQSFRIPIEVLLYVDLSDTYK